MIRAGSSAKDVYTASSTPRGTETQQKEKKKNTKLVLNQQETRGGEAGQSSI